MADTTGCKSIIHAEFFKPLFEALGQARSRRDCPALDDALWLEIGVRRCIDIVQSGRDFLQRLADRHDTRILISTFFASLKSARRLALLDEVGAIVRARMRQAIPDPFARYSCLDGFDLYAGDGHFVAAACHDKARARGDAGAAVAGRTTRARATRYATGHIYTLDLRHHAMSHLDVADQVGRDKEHEMRALKRQGTPALRQGAARGRKVLYVWDRAGIDFRQWHHWKMGAGIYFLSREKDNMSLQVVGKSAFDPAAPENIGIVADEMVGTSAGTCLRRVAFLDAATGVLYTFLTNLPTSVPPGIVALLYRSRWDIEKVFDEFKNKLCEGKSWAGSAAAKACQARLLCLAHNLLTLMEEMVRTREGVRNAAEFRRKDKGRERRIECQEKAGGGPIAHMAHAADRLTVRTVKFVRWLRNHLDLERDWEAAVARLSQIYQHL
jgi:hypothetical protein